MNLTRTPIGLLVEEWASASGALLRPPESESVSRETGLPSEYDISTLIKVGLFNQWLKELTSFLVNVQKTGVPLWVGETTNLGISAYSSSGSTNYREGALVLGSDGNIYICLTSNGSLSSNPVTDTENSHWQLLTDLLEEYAVGAVVLASNGIIYRCRASENSLTTNPVTDTNENVWEQLIRTVPSATESNAGFAQFASDRITIAGRSTNRAITPSGLAAAIADRVSGLSSDGVSTGASLSGTTLSLQRSGSLASISIDLAPLTSALAAKSNPTFTGTVTGVQLGLDDDSEKAATTAFVRALADKLFSVQAGQIYSGVARFATDTEINTGTETNLLISVAGLEQRVENLIGPTGPQGDRGADVPGPQGETGSVGPAGNRGPQGRSIVGAKGIKGPAGIATPGPQGERGPKGASFTGERGETGPQGASIQGIRGIQGEPGRSIVGPQGIPGPQGETGPRGFTGPRGYTGLTGPTGDAGVDGSTDRLNTIFNVDNLSVGVNTGWQTRGHIAIDITEKNVFVLWNPAFRDGFAFVVNPPTITNSQRGLNTGGQSVSIPVVNMANVVIYVGISVLTQGGRSFLIRHSSGPIITISNGILA